MTFLRTSFLIGLLISFEVQAQSNLGELEKSLILGDVFEMLNVEPGVYTYAIIRGEMRALKEANLDTLTSIKGRGMEYDWIKRADYAFNLGNTVLRLIGTGISQEKSLTAAACVNNKKIKINENQFENNVKLLLCALRETEQNIDSLIVDKAIKEALIIHSV